MIVWTDRIFVIVLLLFTFGFFLEKKKPIILGLFLFAVIELLLCFE